MKKKVKCFFLSIFISFLIFCNSIIGTFLIFLFSSIESLWLLRWLHSYKSTTMFTFFPDYSFTILKTLIPGKSQPKETQSSIYSWITIFKSFNLHPLLHIYIFFYNFPPPKDTEKKNTTCIRERWDFSILFFYFLGLVILSVVIFFYHNI